MAGELGYSATKFSRDGLRVVPYYAGIAKGAWRIDVRNPSNKSEQIGVDMGADYFPDDYQLENVLRHLNAALERKGWDARPVTVEAVRALA